MNLNEALENYINSLAENLEEKVTIDYPEYYPDYEENGKLPRLVSYCFGYRGTDHATRNEQLEFGLNVLKKILETDAIKVSGTAEFNKQAELPPEGSDEFEELFNAWMEPYLKEHWENEVAAANAGLAKANDQMKKPDSD